jgi:hypothetical protein
MWFQVFNNINILFFEFSSSFPFVTRILKLIKNEMFFPKVLTRGSLTVEDCSYVLLIKHKAEKFKFLEFSNRFSQVTKSRKVHFKSFQTQ